MLDPPRKPRRWADTCERSTDMSTITTKDDTEIYYKD